MSISGTESISGVEELALQADPVGQCRSEK